MAKILLTILVAVLASVAANQCLPKTCRGKTHTMCLYSSSKPSPYCNKVQTSSLTPEEEQEILDAHNKFRARVASGQESLGRPGPQPAGHIPPLKWDKELAQVAQRWANQCKFGHDKCRDVERFQVGQNVASKMHSNQHVAQMGDLVKMWYDEVKDFDSRQVQSFKPQPEPKIGHYTQLVWGETTLVGCGAVRYFGFDNWYTTYLVCNYGPTGNWIGSPLYQTR
ncbi:venom allergen 5-like [Microplitis demolitor]|uniref:venom allergen 5-like n=1 Tax=Microplitis demolitor TaxID=69319 RepID=UPI0004CCC363|nr:venom allergen 5-like [Microplitis demolitor]